MLMDITAGHCMVLVPTLLTIQSKLFFHVLCRIGAHCKETNSLTICIVLIQVDVWLRTRTLMVTKLATGNHERISLQQHSLKRRMKSPFGLTTALSQVLWYVYDSPSPCILINFQPFTYEFPHADIHSISHLTFFISS